VGCIRTGYWRGRGTPTELPLRWLTGQRILLAQRLLEETGHGVDQVAARAGFGSAMTLRQHFRAWRGTTPAAYRSTFRTPGASDG